MARPVELTPEQRAKVRCDLRVLAIAFGSQSKAANAIGVSDASFSRVLAGLSIPGKRYLGALERANEAARQDALARARTLSSDDLRAILKERE